MNLIDSRREFHIISFGELVYPPYLDYKSKFRSCFWKTMIWWVLIFSDHLLEFLTASYLDGNLEHRTRSTVPSINVTSSNQNFAWSNQNQHNSSIIWVFISNYRLQSTNYSSFGDNACKYFLNYSSYITSHNFLEFQSDAQEEGTPYYLICRVGLTCCTSIGNQNSEIGHYYGFNEQTDKFFCSVCCFNSSSNIRFVLQSTEAVRPKNILLWTMLRNNRELSIEN